MLLPGTVTVLIPSLLIWLGDSNIEVSTAIAGAVIALAGLFLAVSTIVLFVRAGRGTLAPWDPTSRLVVHGPYRYVRNPMITGVALILAGEALFFRSWAIAVEFAVFVAVNAIYFPLVEEPGLHRRFGSEYAEYCARVPRWLPRVRH